MTPDDPLLSISGLTKRFAERHSVIDRARRRAPVALTALDDVGVAVQRGEALGVVGESGSGKSTLARCIVKLLEPDAGTITFDGTDVLAASGPDLLAFRRSVQMVYQDPYTSLNPRLRIGAAVAEPALVHGLIARGEEEDYAAGLLERVGIRREAMRRLPHEFSGGQRQRIAIARSLAVQPRLLVADEAVSALDVSIQAQLLSLLEEIRADLGLTIIFIAHQLAVISRLADRVAIMYLGRIVEMGATADVFANPRHPYTQALLQAHPRLDGPRVREAAVTSDASSAFALPKGCRFRARCPAAADVCGEIDPEDQEVASSRGGHQAACHVLPRMADAASIAAASTAPGVGPA